MHPGKKLFSPAPISLAVSLLALCLAAIAFTLTLLRPEIPGKGIRAYDFSTPQKAIESQMLIHAEQDVLAQLQYEVAKGKTEADKKRRTAESLKFDRTIEYDGKVLVFFKFSDGGLDRYKAIESCKRNVHHRGTEDTEENARISKAF